MHSVVASQVFLVQAQLHEERNGVLAVESVAQHIHCLLELRRTQIATQLTHLLLLLGQILAQTPLLLP